MSKKLLPKAFTDRLEFSGLTEDEKQSIRERAFEQIAKEKKARAEEAYFDAALKDAKKADEPTLQMEDVFIDLPGHAVRLLIDGVEYLHGFTYEVNSLQAQTMREMVQRAWDHEDEIGGANRNFYNKPRNLNLTRRSQNITTSRLMHGV
jgi:hypothetical protein